MHQVLRSAEDSQYTSWKVEADIAGQSRPGYGSRIIRDKKLQSRDVAAVSRPPCFEPRGSKVEDFGLETEPTSANRKNQ